MKQDSLSKTYFLYFIILLFLVVFRILSAVGVLTVFGDAGDYVFTLFVQVFVLFGISVFAFGKFHKKSTKEVLNEYAFKKISLKSIILSFGIGIVVYFLNSYIATFFYFLLSFLGFSTSGSVIPQNYGVGTLMVNILFTAVLPAICEETAHRGMLLSQMKKKSGVFAIITSSILFGLLHVNIYQFFYASILGALLAVLTISSASILPAMIVHFVNNALNVYFVFAYVNNLFSAKVVGFVFGMMETNSMFGLTFSLLFFVFLLFLLYFLYVELCKESAKRKLVKLQNGFGRFLARKIFFEEIELLNGKKTQKEEELIDLGEILGDGQKQTEVKSTFYSKLFLFSAVFLSALTTIFTLVWGII